MIWCNVNTCRTSLKWRRLQIHYGNVAGCFYKIVVFPHRKTHTRIDHRTECTLNGELVLERKFTGSL